MELTEERIIKLIIADKRANKYREEYSKTEKGKAARSKYFKKKKKANDKCKNRMIYLQKTDPEKWKQLVDKWATSLSAEEVERLSK